MFANFMIFVFSVFYVEMAFNKIIYFTFYVADDNDRVKWWC